MVLSLAAKSEKSSKFGSVSEVRRSCLYGVGGSALDLSLDELVGEDDLEGEEQGEHRGVSGYLDLFGELRQYLMVLSQTWEAASALLPPKYLTRSSNVQSFW